MMVRLGLRLSLRSGKEAAVRLVLITAAVAIGVGVLLSTLSLFNAFQVTGARPSWERTAGSAPSGWALGATTNADLWNYHEDYYAGRLIKRLDVAALGARAPVPPGLTRVPGPGTYYASPALAALLDSVPADRLGDRFPGTLAGLIGRAALSGPDDLVVIVGQPPEEVAALTGTTEVDTIATRPAVDGNADLYQLAFGVVAIGLTFPLLVLIGTASRLAAARREARFAAIRLVGATSRQINIIASVDAAVGALLGAVAGVVLHQVLRPAVAGVPITGTRFFPDLVAPTALQYAGVVAGVPVAAACAALLSLRRVRITPLGAATKAVAPAPRAWRVVPLLAGLALFAVPAILGHVGEPNPVLVEAGLLLIMIGLLTGGSWLTMLGGRLTARLASGAAALLAAQRLTADPRAAFRSVNGLVLAVFVGTAVAGIVPAVLSGQQAVGDGTLSGVLRASFVYANCQGCASIGRATLSPETGADLLARLGHRPGVSLLPVYTKATSRGLPPPCLPGARCQGPPPQVRTIVPCAALGNFAAFGRCSPGAPAVEADFEHMLTHDNMLSLGKTLPLVDAGSPAFSGDLTHLGLVGVLIGTPDTATLEEARTLLAPYTARAGAVGAPRTFGELTEARAVLFDEAERVGLVMVALTLLVAGCGVVVAAGGALLERRRPFTLLRLCGTPARTLYRVVLYESALPLVLAAVLAAGSGLGVAVPIVEQLGVKDVSVGLPGPVYFLTVGAGLIGSLAVIAAILPLLKRITAPDSARFE